MFKRFDINKDGVLEWGEIWDSIEPVYSKIKGKQYHWKTSNNTTAAEFKTMIRSMFDCADENRDGVLQLEEFKQFTLFVLEGLEGLNLHTNQSSVGEMFSKLDKNKDGVLEWNEIWPSVEPMIETLQLRYDLKSEWNSDLK
jgi:Ca2+-binding EF-hand superfamily protein